VTITNSLFATIDQCGATETRIYQFTATDAAGNSSQCTASVVITDTTVTNDHHPSRQPNRPIATVRGNSEALLAWLNAHGGRSGDGCLR
jgi:hypothetical protein